MQTEHYVYAYLDPRKQGSYIYGEYKFDFEPFYIGMGKGDRMYHHLKLRDKKNILKVSKIKKIILEFGSDPIIIKYKEFCSEDEAYDLEKSMIESIGRISKKTGPLVNVQEGGRSGGVWTPERRLNISNGHKGKIVTEEARKNLSIACTGELNGFFGKGHSDEQKQKWSETRKNTRLGSENTFFGKEHSLESKAKIGAKSKQRTKYYYIATSPDGIIYDNITNKKDFVLEHNIAKNQNNVDFRHPKSDGKVYYNNWIFERILKDNN